MDKLRVKNKMGELTISGVLGVVGGPENLVLTFNSARAMLQRLMCSPRWLRQWGCWLLGWPLDVRCAGRIVGSGNAG